MENNSNTDLFQAVRCPNCGNWAERHFYSISQRISTECATCDYLMVTSAVTGSVIEAYAPGQWTEGCDLSMANKSHALVVSQSSDLNQCQNAALFAQTYNAKAVELACQVSI
jgi:ribosomal protein S27E